MTRGFAIAALFMPMLCACATKPPATPDPIVITKEVERIVQVRCEDKRETAPEYPDTRERLSAIPEDNIFALAQARVAGQILRDARLAESEAQIKACAGD